MSDLMVLGLGILKVVALWSPVLLLMVVLLTFEDHL